MNEAILLQEVQDFLGENASSVPAKIALKKSPFPLVSSAELASQIASKQKAEKKLLLWHQTAGIYFPPSVSIEQSSSEETASYKLNLIENNIQLIDLTGGFGVDAYYFSTKAGCVVHCETNIELSAIAKHNAQCLGAKNISFIAGDGIQYLKKQKADHFAIAYIDPSRRAKKGKVFKLDDSEPNIIESQEDIIQQVPKIIIKTSPLLDISATLSTLRNVKTVHILSIKNECKEILYVVERAFETAPEILAIGLGNKDTFTFSFFPEEEKNAIASYGLPERFLFEPDAAVLKSGSFKLISERLHLRKFHQHTHLYTSNETNKNFPGKTFEILKVEEYGTFKKRKEKTRANVISRNFPLKAEEIRKKHGIEDGGETYLFFCKVLQEQLKVIKAQRLF